MPDLQPHDPEAPSLEGRVFRPSNPRELAEAIEQAFDYRGDVTLYLVSGEAVEGYLFNRVASGPRPLVQVFPKGLDRARDIAYAEIVAIAFTGKDTASGKSWEAWVAKKDAQRRTEAEQAEAAARTRGHL